MNENVDEGGGFDEEDEEAESTVADTDGVEAEGDDEDDGIVDCG